ncbi:hypothetical protein BCV69DRAFT_284663 [Microstroma glucosiphilum]|uniref:Amino-acid acetyltransferase, mitochondrial n=1 Tax=Pseudomicrostroma glucosiphilum TaxID=1684307 RepID=A0A316U194_9BASI|nr:hypothetical protein BCV69DRAFT_284663 [Pseudomicrostroma glucosiphilum]PWN19067.1 hypothetical protein BCV69DRAFT_284663 [Pseudomicrostroma glucosiphilum]
MQNLILEVLNAQPSLRDSKGYLKTFGPRASRSSPPGQTGVDSRGPVAQQRLKTRQGLAGPSARAAARSQLLSPGSAARLPVGIRAKAADGSSQDGLPHRNQDHLREESHSHPDSQIASTSNSKIPKNAETTAQGSREGASSTSASPHSTSEAEGLAVQQHTALVKVQGPFTRRQLESIADGMIYLKKLGLVSVIVVDGEEWSLPGYTSEFSSDGIRMEQAEEDKEDNELAAWIGRNLTEEKKERRRQLSKMRRATLRRAMLNDVNALADLLHSRGAPARPFLSPLFKVDAELARDAELLAPRHFPGAGNVADPNSSSGSSAATALQNKDVATTATPLSHPQVRAFGYRQMQASASRSPLVSDDGLSSLRSALATDHIPVIAPLALYSDPEADGGETSTPVKADDVLVALARDMAIAGREAEEYLLEMEESGSEDLHGLMASHVDMTPLRLMVINREGGIPSHARGGNPHLAINLASEYSHILNSFVWKESHPTAMENLRMVHDCLSYMPHTSSGIVVSHRSPRSLIANLITNKAAHSPSLPPALLRSYKRDLRHTPTIIRPGLSINVIYDFSQVDQTKLTALLEASFKRKLNAEAYYERLRKSCDFVIVSGDYQGAAIVTLETSADDPPGVEPMAYLDKFAVLPSLQGSGTVDFLWGALRDEVQGLGLLDALNDNGGKGGFGKGRDLVWKSRGDNPVNKWYYERSNGFAKIDLNPRTEAERAGKTEEELQKGRNWAMFWCDAEERLSSMSGERRLSTSATEEEMRSVLLDEEQRSASGGGGRGGGDGDGRRFSDYEEEGEGWGRSSAPRSSASLMPSLDSRRLEELDPRPGGGGQRLLPLIAPEEQGRLERWAKCMMNIPSAWL